jgi:tetratricopeptide (TPR) repeat protein
MQAFGHLCFGDMKLSQESSEKGIQVALDPAYGLFPKGTLFIAYFIEGRFSEAENVLQYTLDSSKKNGFGQFSAVCELFLAPIFIAKGHMRQGMKLIEKARKTLAKNQRRGWYATSEYILGEVNSQIATGPKPSFLRMAKNIGFLLKYVPYAGKKAEEHFNKSIELFKEIGAKSSLGQVYLSLGMLYRATKRMDQARQCILNSIDIFQECEAEGWLKQANEALESIT